MEKGERRKSGHCEPHHTKKYEHPKAGKNETECGSTVGKQSLHLEREGVRENVIILLPSKGAVLSSSR